MISWCCDSAGEELDRRDRCPRSSRSDGLIELSGEARASVERCQRSFDHPAPGQHHEALCCIGPLDDLDSLFVDPVQRLLQLVTCATTIGKDLAQPLEAIADRGQQHRYAIAIRDVGSVDQGVDEIALGFFEGLALAPLNLLAWVRHPMPAALLGSNALAADDTRARRSLAACHIVPSQQKSRRQHAP